MASDRRIVMAGCTAERSLVTPEGSERAPLLSGNRAADKWVPAFPKNQVRGESTGTAVG